jgi:glucosamine-6-phosphate deaminase
VLVDEREPRCARSNAGTTEQRQLYNQSTGCSMYINFVGIGEKGHLAFNDPPADFATAQPYLVVHVVRVVE